MAGRKDGEPGPGGGGEPGPGGGGGVGMVWVFVEGFMEENRSCPMRLDE